MISNSIRNKYVKKVLGLTIFLIVISVNAYSQVNSNAIGLRIFKGRFQGVELSYQGSGTGFDRVEFDLGYENNDHYKRYYAAVIPNSGWGNIYKGLNWYAGSALVLGYLSSPDDLMESFTFGLGLQIGLEYDFNKHDIPVLVSFDTRPIYDLSLNDHYEEGIIFNTALSIRYIY